MEGNKKESVYKPHIHELINDISDEEFLKKIYSILIFYRRRRGGNHELL